MAKFKVGDRVRSRLMGNLMTVREAIPSWRDGRIVYSCSDGDYRGTFWGEHLELVPPTAQAVSGAIRTVTRREIVPGVYGRVSVGSTAGDAVWIVLDGSRNATELREAAHLFNQIAEVLEENAKEAA